MIVLIPQTITVSRWRERLSSCRAFFHLTCAVALRETWWVSFFITAACHYLIISPKPAELMIFQSALNVICSAAAVAFWKVWQNNLLSIFNTTLLKLNQQGLRKRCWVLNNEGSRNYPCTIASPSVWTVDTRQDGSMLSLNSDPTCPRHVSSSASHDLKNA